MKILVPRRVLLAVKGYKDDRQNRVRRKLFAIEGERTGREYEVLTGVLAGLLAPGSNC